MSPIDDQLIKHLLDIKEDIGEIKGESKVIRKQVDDMYTVQRESAAQGCAVAQENKKKINKMWAFVTSASAAIGAAVGKMFN